MSKQRKKIRKEDFKRWLRARQNVEFGCGGEDCPLHAWLGRDINLGDLDELPPWCSRFTGWWDACHSASDSNLYGAEALAFMNEAF